MNKTLAKILDEYGEKCLRAKKMAPVDMRDWLKRERALAIKDLLTYFHATVDNVATYSGDIKKLLENQS